MQKGTTAARPAPEVSAALASLTRASFAPRDDVDPRYDSSALTFSLDTGGLC